MAKRPKIDFKALLLAHVEKLVAGLVLLCFGMLIWYSLTRPGLPPGQEPENIISEAERSEVHIQKTTWEDFNSKPQLRNFAQESGWYDLPRRPYQLQVDLDPNPWPKQGLRTDPKYFTVRDLEAHYDQGPMALQTADMLRRRFGQDGAAIPKEVQVQIDAAAEKPPQKKVAEADPAGAGLVDAEGVAIKIKFIGSPVDESEVAEGRRWIMVNALVPIQDQIDAFDDSFREAAGLDQKNDIPLYLGYEVERADVTGGIDPVWQPLESVSQRSRLVATLRWMAPRRTEIIDRRYVHDLFTWPLAPRLLAEWGERDKHSQVPLAPTGSAPKEAGNLLGDGPLPGMGAGAGGIEDLIPAARPRNEDNQETQKIAYQMLRYFDFTVQPGHAYRYRMRIALRDPNFVRNAEERGAPPRRVEIKLLDPTVVERITKKREALEKKYPGSEFKTPEDREQRIYSYMQINYSDWSEPSPAVKVPLASFVLALDTTPAPEGRYNEEPSARLMVTTFDIKLGLETGGDTKLQRGGLANFQAEKVKIIDLNYSTFDQRTVTFNPNLMLVDVRGGNALGKSAVKAPGELLLFDIQTGKLVVTDEIEDAESVQGFHQRQAALEALIPAAPATKGLPTGPADLNIIQ